VKSIASGVGVVYVGCPSVGSSHGTHKIVAIPPLARTPGASCGRLAVAAVSH
jgi:hypothetical protein